MFCKHPIRVKHGKRHQTPIKAGNTETNLRLLL